MRSKTALFILFACLGPAAAHSADMNTVPGSDSNKFMRHSDRSAKPDRNVLRAEVDETQALLDALARESHGLGPEQTEPLFKSLREEYHLDAYVGKARKALNKAEEIVEVQAAIKLQEAQAKAVSVADAPAEESKLLGLQSELTGIVEDLRDILRDVHREANEDTARDLRNWLMISEGLLRNRREEAQATGSTATPVGAGSPRPGDPAEAPLTYEGVSPAAGTEAIGLSTSAGALTPGTTPTAEATPAPKKKGRR